MLNALGAWLAQVLAAWMNGCALHGRPARR
jgi:hypothetical protein